MSSSVSMVNGGEIARAFAQASQANINAATSRLERLNEFTDAMIDRQARQLISSIQPSRLENIGQQSLVRGGIVDQFA